MTIVFTLDHTFRAASPSALLAAYFDPEHLAMLDAATGVGARTVRESIDDGINRVCTWQLTTLQALPWFVRRLVTGGRLTYLETVRWRRSDPALALSNVCELLGGQVRIEAVYQLAPAGERLIHQRFAGAASSDIKLVGERVARATVDQLARAMPTMTECTQRWLDRRRAE